jgi:hypothetical protein
VALELLRKHGLVSDGAYAILRDQVYPKVLGGENSVGALKLSI